ncbi:DUF6230 family protein [Kyrpidia tusciae]|uniref:Uncharacterized protein n=1 Tax=Kyrpidia tusciae (strain DSM 2912 / NBRC 15312 / T2) TaxID=562970 RepID=D5WWV4_KYRT2|nr:DUF6230 family protein [Kyrpidia tusciae]ADG05805.1 conserved hypothetical protein [Kyrpidia tusciae DSM 2912]
MLSTAAVQTNRKRFFAASGVGLGGLVVLLASLFLTGTVYAAFPLTGIGGFVISADEIIGQQMNLYPALGQTSEQSIWPQAAIELSSATIKGLNLTKDLDVSKELGNFGMNKVKVVIGATKDVQGSGLKLRITGLQADQANFSTFDMEEKYSDNPLNKLGMTSSQIDLVKPQLNTHSLVAQSLGIPGMSLSLEVYDKDGKQLP